MYILESCLAIIQSITIRSEHNKYLREYLGNVLTSKSLELSNENIVVTLSKVRPCSSDSLRQLERLMVECTTTGGRPSLEATRVQGRARERGSLEAGLEGSRWTQE